MKDSYALIMKPAELADEFSRYTGARWVVDQGETFSTDIVCPTADGGRVTVRRFSTSTRTDREPWGVFTTAGTVRNEYRGSFSSAEEAVDHAKSLFTWHSPAEYVARDGEVWAAIAVDIYRLPDWSEVVYFTEGETFGHARPRFGRLGWVVGQWFGDVLPTRWKARQSVMGWFLRFIGGGDCSCEFEAPCSMLIHQGEHCWSDDPEGDGREPCVGCGRPLYSFQVSFSYSDGPIACRKCAPTTEQVESERKECRDAKGGECCDRDTCGQGAKCFPPDMTAKAIENLERLGGKADIPARTRSA